MNGEGIFDVIVVGSGASGGMAAKCLTERGLRVVMLEAGADPTDLVSEDPEQRPRTPEGFRAAITTAAKVYEGEAKAYANAVLGKPRRDDVYAFSSVRPSPTFEPERQAIQSQCRGYGPGTGELYIDDIDHPYMTPAAQPFSWIRSRHLGGRTQIWKRVAPRMTDHEFKAAHRDGHGEPWPITYEDLRPYYEEAERVLRVVGAVELGAEPHDAALSQREMTAVEIGFKMAVEPRWPDRHVGLAPYATPLAPGEPEDMLDARINQTSMGRRPTYDCSVRHSIAQAKKTGLLKIITGAPVRHVIWNEKTGQASGVAYVKGDDLVEVRAKFVVLAASTLESTRILLNSKDARWPNGLANSSGVLGCYLMDHLFGVGVAGYRPDAYVAQGFPDLFLPVFRNLPTYPKMPNFIRGYQMVGEVQAIRAGPMKRWHTGLVLTGQGEVLPEEKNRVTIDESVKDIHGIPCLRIEFQRSANEVAMANDIVACAEEMLTAAGYEIIARSKVPLLPGASVHEMGTARMGEDPKRSVLNSYCQSWDVPNLYVTDGAAFTSAGCQNPTLTIMALTARACGHIVEQLKKGAG